MGTGKVDDGGWGALRVGPELVTHRRSKNASDERMALPLRVNSTCDQPLANKSQPLTDLGSQSSLGIIPVQSQPRRFEQLRKNR